ncbi:MAG: hypothetical protein ABIM98_06915 [candidate division WOR-3 bacterium]
MFLKETKYLFNDKEKTDISKGEELYWLFFALKILLEICFWVDLGKFKQEKIKEVFRKFYGYKFLETRKFFSKIF